MDQASMPGHSSKARSRTAKLLHDDGADALRIGYFAPSLSNHWHGRHACLDVIQPEVG